MLICMRTGARARERVVAYLCVSPAGWEAIIGGSEEWTGGGGEQDWDSLGFCFSLENVVGPFFLVRLGPLFLGGWAAVAELRSAQGSGPSSAPGGTGRDAGTGCALPAALGGCQALHLMRSGAFPTRRARSSPSRPRALPRAVETRTVSPACGPAGALRRPRRGLPRPLPGTRARCRGRAHRCWLLAAPALGRGSCPSLPGVTALGRRGRAGRPLLAFPPTTLGGAFVLPLSGEAVHLPALAPAPGPPGL